MEKNNNKYILKNFKDNYSYIYNQQLDNTTLKVYDNNSADLFKEFFNIINDVKQRYKYKFDVESFVKTGRISRSDSLISGYLKNDMNNKIKRYGCKSYLIKKYSDIITHFLITGIDIEKVEILCVDTSTYTIDTETNKKIYRDTETIIWTKSYEGLNLINDVFRSPIIITGSMFNQFVIRITAHSVDEIYFNSTFLDTKELNIINKNISDGVITNGMVKNELI